MPHVRLKRVTRIPRLPARRRDAHKGDFGRVLVIGGSHGMLGAPALCANAAYRSGAGLVRIATEESNHRHICVLAPCATMVPHADLDAATNRKRPPATTRALIGSVWKVLHEAVQTNDVIALGPGWGCSPARSALLGTLLRSSKKPLVIDADGLNCLCQIEDWWRFTRRIAETGGAVVLTPHPGEMQRLLDAAEIRRNAKGDRVRVAVELSRKCGAIVVHKGAGTVVTDGQRVFVNRTGNPGMASGGTGDVLTGVIAALIGQGLAGLDAAILAVHVHGLSGDLAAKALGEVSLMASDLVDCLPLALRRRRLRDRRSRQGAIVPARGSPVLKKGAIALSST